MATTYHHHRSRCAPPARHKRKGIPMRSPCQRDMAEAPGVVFRFPDKIASIASAQDLSTTGVSAVVPGLNILPSSAGLPSGLGAKTAVSVIVAATAAAVTDTLALPLPTPLTATSTPLVEELTPGDERSGGSQANSASSTPMLGPVASSAIAAVPIHRSASNVLHYPELLSDLRDRLIQIHQVSHHHLNHHTSSGVESDGNHNQSAQQQNIKRARVKRMAGASAQRAGIYTSPGARRSGLRGSGAAAGEVTAASSSIALLPGSLPAAMGHGSAAAVGRSRSELNSTQHGMVENLTAGAAKAAESASFQRRHSIGTVQAQLGAGMDDDDDEILDIVDSESTASSSGQRRHANQPQGQVHRQLQVGGMATAAISRGVPAVPRLGPSAPVPKRKRDKDAVGDRRSGSPLAHPYYHHHQRFHPHPHPKHPAAVLPAPPGGDNIRHGGAAFGGSKRSCASCGASSTPCWRPGLIDSMTLCNLCGLRYKKGKVYCAACSYVPTKTEIATGGASICRRCSSSIHMPNVIGIAGSPSSSPMPGGVPAPHTHHHRHNAGF
ncbi:DNA-binding transcription repressor [Coemansia sp. IMI 209128]|nr:DNA-binding transcription repressor [Coemansia sp. IMI 209128]